MYPAAVVRTQALVLCFRYRVSGHGRRALASRAPSHRPSGREFHGFSIRWVCYHVVYPHAREHVGINVFHLVDGIGSVISLFHSGQACAGKYLPGKKENAGTITNGTSRTVDARSGLTRLV